MSASSSIVQRQSLLLLLVAGVALTSLPLGGTACAADTPFVDQIPNGITAALPNSLSGLRAFDPAAAQWLSPKLPLNSLPLPQVVAPHIPNANFAQTIEIGSHNTVIQGQVGIGDTSNVGVIGGNANNVFVGQDGNDLRSNVLLIGTNGMNVGVLEPNGSPPVDLAIIRTRNGTIIIPR